MANKKGQIAIFIIIGMIVLVSVPLLLYLNTAQKNNPQIEKISKMPFEVAPIADYIKSCITNVAEDGLTLISKQGGYYDLPIISTVQFTNNTAFYFYHGLDMSPDLENIEKEFSLLIEKELDSCIKFELFESQGFEIKKGILNATITIIDKEIIFGIDYPLEFKKEEGIINLKDFNAQIPSKLKQFYELSKQIIEEQKNEPNYVLESFILNLIYDNNISYDLIEDEDTVVYALIDAEPDYSEFPEEDNETYYAFMFAVKYDWEDLNKSFVKIEHIESQKAYVDYEFNYQVTVSGEGITYSDYTSLFDIGPKTGLISFTPAVDQVDDYDILIKAEDSFGNEDYAILNLSVAGQANIPVIKEIPDQTVTVNEIFFIKVEASIDDNSKLFYLDDSDLFDINPENGIIAFVPNETGTHLIEVTAVSLNGLKDSELFYLTIENG